MHQFKRFHRLYLKDRPTRSRTLRRLYRHPVLIPIVTFLVLTAISIGLFLILNGGKPRFQPISSYIVILSHDHLVQTVPTNEPTVGALLTKLNIKLSSSDVVEPSASTPITEDNFRINIYRAKPVQIIDESNITYAFSAATTPRSIADQAGVKVYPEDYVSVQPVNNFLLAGSIGEQLLINRATPVYLNLYGTGAVIRTHSQTVGDLLAAKHIHLAKGDSLMPASRSTAVTANMQVFVIRNGTSIATVTQSIPMPVQTVNDSSLSFGTTAIRQAGSPGQEILTYQVNLQNGVEVSRSLIQTVIIQEPVAEIIARGQAVQIPGDKEAVMAEAGISSSDYAYVNYIVSNESGWCPTKVQGDIGYCPGYPPQTIPSYLGYGLGQATPGDKMAPFGSDWETNPVTQLRWATSYADSRYGSWAAAYNHWSNYHNW